LRLVDHVFQDNGTVLTFVDTRCLDGPMTLILRPTFRTLASAGCITLLLSRLRTLGRVPDGFSGYPTHWVGPSHDGYPRYLAYHLFSGTQ
jgi:hypothetical protein